LSSFAKISIVIIVLIGVQSVDAQRNCKKMSPRSETESIGANYSVQLSTLYKVRTIFGAVNHPTSAPIPTAIVDVYRVSKFPKKSEPSKIASEVTRMASYQAKNGRFCLADLPDGNYVLRFGTDQFAFAHLYIKVRKSKSASSIPIKVELSVGN
jgi:hypothetical protein